MRIRPSQRVASLAALLSLSGALLLAPSVARGADQLTFAGVLGNSGGSDETLVTFSETPACGIGPVLDGAKTLWERGGAGRLNRYALDGRLLASFPLPPANHRFHDQLTLVDDQLLILLGKHVYRLPCGAAPGTTPERLEGEADCMSSSAYAGQVAIMAQGELCWLHATTHERTPILSFDQGLKHLWVETDGTIFGFTDSDVYAWRQGSLVNGYPRAFRGARPQKIDRFWYAHAFHGTINRFNEQFEPDPGVVLGGASGSFIGYLPESADIIHGAGLVHVGDDLFAVSGLEGIVQLLRWREADARFEVVRRLGAFPAVDAVAIDAAGTIWTPGGSWRWTAGPETPLSLGDTRPQQVTQPVVLGGTTLCFLKRHYGNLYKTHGPLLDANGWSHFTVRGMGGLSLSDQPLAATAFMNPQGRLRLLVTPPDGDAVEFPLSESGDIGSEPTAVKLPGLQHCTSLAWFAGHLLAADQGKIAVFRPAEQGWEYVRQLDGFGPGIFIHSDGSRLVVSDADRGMVELFDSLDNAAAVARYEGLVQPQAVAIAGPRVVVHEAGRQRLVKLRHDAAAAAVPQRSVRRLAATEPAAFDDADFFTLSNPGGIPVAVALRETPAGLDVALRVPADVTDVTIGLANDREAFIVDGPAARLPAGDWSTLRLAARVSRPSRQERIGFVDFQPIHAPFSDQPAAWAPFDMRQYREIVAERRDQIRIAFSQPIDGKASLVIEDEAGRRIRHLVAGRSFPAGEHTVIWDGLDDTGKLVPPGSYRWRGVSHPGVKPVFRQSFAGGREPVNARPWGPNHGLLVDAAATAKHVLFAAPVTEGGWAMMALNPDGSFAQGYELVHGLGIGCNRIAVDENYLYAAQDGFSWGGGKDIDWSKSDWTSTWTVSVARYDLQTGKLVEFPGKQRAITVDTVEVGPGSAHPDLQQPNLAAVAVHDGRIYVGCRDKGTVFVLDAATGEHRDKLPLAGVRQLAAGPEGVIAATDQGLVRLADGKLLVAADGIDFTGLTVAAGGDLWASDGKSHQVHHFSAAGRLIETLGTPGGPYQGAYDPNRMVNPRGLVFGPDGKLWVTEARWNPKRVLAWDLQKKTVVFEKFGLPHYGGSGSGFDPEKPGRWIGMGCLWDIDLAAGTARPTSVMASDEAHFEHYHPMGYSFFREHGRTFLATRGKISLLLELLDDGTTRPIAATAGAHLFAYGCGWKPPQAYIDAFYAKWPEKRQAERPGRDGQGKPWAARGAGVLWVDRNADGSPQAAEFSFTDEGVSFAESAWGHLQHSLTMRVPAKVGDQVKLIEIAPRGFLANGIPDYPSLTEAMEQGATPIDLTPGYKREGVATARDRFGRFVFNSDPEMNAYAADGRHLWSYPNRWSDVHGSHQAPLPETGVMQGTLGILGMAPFDDEADVFFLNGNHGRCFLLTSDGIYLDECFTDVRVSYQQNEYRLGGEIFGGMFDRVSPTGPFFVQIGHGPYRIYELQGLAEAKRISGRVEVGPSQIAAAERSRLRQAAETQAQKLVQLPAEIRWDRNGKFPVRLEASIANGQLRLRYAVEDSSPWVNHGRDWTTLFATGDAVDLQIATDATADPNRRDPVAGDQRLLIAGFEGEPIAVLYQFRKPGGANPVEFTSPWRGLTVDNVERLTDVAIAVKTTANRGYVVEATIPLATIGLEQSSGPVRADFGVLFGDADGRDTQLRSYWANPATMLVDDIPGEAMVHPNLWGVLQLPERPY